MKNLIRRKKVDKKETFNQKKFNKWRDFDKMKAYLDGTDLSDFNKNCYICLFHMGNSNPIKAMEVAKEMVASLPEEAFGYAMLGFAEHRVGWTEAAYDNLKKAKKMKPDIYHTNTLWFFFEYLTCLRTMKAHKDTIKFLAEVEAAEQTLVEPAEIMFIRSLNYADMGLYGFAWGAYNNGYKANPNHHRAAQTREILNWNNCNNASLDTVH